MHSILDSAETAVQRMQCKDCSAETAVQRLKCKDCKCKYCSAKTACSAQAGHSTQSTEYEIEKGLRAILCLTACSDKSADDVVCFQHTESWFLELLLDQNQDVDDNRSQAGLKQF